MRLSLRERCEISCCLLPGPDGVMAKKTMEMNQDHIDRLHKIFGVKTEKEAVNRAMEMILADEEIIEAHRRMSGKGDLIEEAFE